VKGVENGDAGLSAGINDRIIVTGSGFHHHCDIDRICDREQSSGIRAFQRLYQLMTFFQNVRSVLRFVFCVGHGEASGAAAVGSVDTRQFLGHAASPQLERQVPRTCWHGSRNPVHELGEEL
jgi:hypothetical protein